MPPVRPVPHSLMLGYYCLASMTSSERNDEKPPAKRNAAPGVRTPFPGESSGSNVPVPNTNDDEATVLDARALPDDPDATMVGASPLRGNLAATPVDADAGRDQDATLVDAKPLDPEATLVDLKAAIAPKPMVRQSPPRSRGSDSGASAAVLEIGDLLGGRYEILQLLGEGGMGAVYKAADRELDRFVALKVIRRELASDPSILARFKQELLLAHQVTHRNVIRIYDLSEADGVKFITMEFIEGRDLRSLVREKKKYAPEEAVEIIQQVCFALEAAHNVGVIHRDLKPQNIMQDSTGRILVMDFGLARTLGGDGLTETGAIVGTMEYMSPEQALGKNLDQRSDIFALGLILYEMLTGKGPFGADSALASLIKRTQERATPVSDVDAKIPGALSVIVSRCLERNLDERYQKVSDIVADLNTWKDKRAAGTIRLDASVKPWGQTIPWPLMGGIFAALVLAAAGFLFRGRLLSPTSSKTSAPAAPTVALAILPFRNASTDQSLDWLGPSLADMLTTDVGQSATLRTVSSSNLHQIFSDLRISSSTVLDPATIKRVADFSSADRVVWGQYAKFGDTIRIDATLQDIKSNRTVPLKVDAASEKDIPGAIDHLADSIRQTLALPADVLKELKASSFQPTSSSVNALRDFNLGMSLQRDGKDMEAQKLFESSTEQDPNFALAFARLAQSYSTLGYDSEAEQAAKKAVGLSQGLPEAEKYLITAIQLQVVKNYPDAIKAYENLAKVSPDNSDVQAALARLYEDSGDFARARAYYGKILASNPKNAGAMIDLGRAQIKSGDAQGSLDPLNRAYSLSIEVDNQEQKASSLHLIAVAYRILSKPEEGLRNEEQALQVWRQIGQKRGLALSLNEMGRCQVLLGKTKDATANFQEALQIRREIGDTRGLGDTLLDLGNLSDDRGDHDQALKLYKEALDLERDIGNENLQASCLNNIGNVYFERNRFDDALTYYQQVLQLREKAKVPKDIADAVTNLGETLTLMGRYDEAIPHYMRALDLRRGINDRRGAALDSYGLGALFDYQGRFGAAVSAKQDALKILRDLKDGSAWMPEVLGSYGESLVLAGRGDEAKAPLEEALNLSRQLKNDGSVAKTLEFQGNAFFYQGNFSQAHSLYEQALQAATRSKDQELILLARIGKAEAEVRARKGPQAIPQLRTLVQQADDLGLKYRSAECSIFLAEAMMQSHDYANARQELQRALARSDKLGQQALSVHAHYLLGNIARDSADQAEEQENYRSVVNTLDTMKKDPGAEKLLQRSDLKQMYEESSRWLQTGKS